MIYTILYTLTMATAFPIGYLLAWLARDELVKGRKWFIALAVLASVLTIPIALSKSSKLPMILTLFFVSILSLVAFWKSKDKKWTKPAF